jgi:hypothetical protein
MALVPQASQLTLDCPPSPTGHGCTWRHWARCDRSGEQVRVGWVRLGVAHVRGDRVGGAIIGGVLLRRGPLAQAGTPFPTLAEVTAAQMETVPASRGRTTLLAAVIDHGS